MGVLPVTITETAPDELVSQRALDRSLRAAYQEMGETWVVDYLGLHFRAGNATRYGYKPRSAGWIKRKKFFARIGLSLYGGEVPLVDRGRMKDMIRSGLTIRAYPTRCTIRLPGPRYLQSRPNPRGRGRNRPDMAAEILRVLPDEMRQLEQAANRKLAEQIEVERAKALKRQKKVAAT